MAAMDEAGSSAIQLPSSSPTTNCLGYIALKEKTIKEIYKNGKRNR